MRVPKYHKTVHAIPLWRLWLASLTLLESCRPSLPEGHGHVMLILPLVLALSTFPWLTASVYELSITANLRIHHQTLRISRVDSGNAVRLRLLGCEPKPANHDCTSVSYLLQPVRPHEVCQSFLFYGICWHIHQNHKDLSQVQARSSVYILQQRFAWAIFLTYHPPGKN